MRVSSLAAAAGAVILLSIPWSRVVASALESLMRFFQSITLIALITAVACVVVRWIVPLVLEILTKPLQDGIAAVAGLVLLPEYALTTIMRWMGRSPFRIAYDLGDAMTWVVRTSCVTVRITFEGLSRAARSVHPAIVAVISGGIALGQVLGQL